MLIYSLACHICRHQFGPRHYRKQHQTVTHTIWYCKLLEKLAFCHKLRLHLLIVS